MTRFYYFI